jgi:RNA-binding protein
MKIIKIDYPKIMKNLTPKQKKHLKGLAHHLDPVVIIGQKGITKNLIDSINQALNDHELIKIRFNDFKEDKKSLAKEIVQRTHSFLVSIIGHQIILFKQNQDIKKRKIDL